VKNEEKLLKRAIERAKKILIITHRGPDLDAFCSMILAYKILKNTYPEKDITMKAKQYPSFKLPQMENIMIVESIDYDNEDLLIGTDLVDLSIAADSEKDTIQNSNVYTILIDHHKTENGNDIMINESRSSATEQVYCTFKKILGRKFKLDNDIASLVQYGIVADTGRFLYDITTPDTYRVFAEVKEFYSVDLENFTYKSSKFPQEATPAIIEFLQTTNIKDDMVYMYISRETIKEKNLTKQGVNEAQVFLRDKFMRFIHGVHWGFIVRPSFEKDDTWIVSLRSTQGYQEVDVIAEQLGGGGHKYSGGIHMIANSVDEVLEKLLSTVESITS
jgi:phosphoesterase RecJ-like protein